MCTQEAGDSLLTTAVGSEMDTERFCFFECEPAPKIDKSSATKAGDSCRHLSKVEENAVKDASGNAVAPMETAATMSHFLESKKPKVTAVALGDRIVKGAVDLASIGVAHAAAAAAKPEKPPKKAKPWASVGDPIGEQVAKVVEWAKEAQTAAAKSAVDAAKVKDAGTKASGSMTNVLAEVGNAKAAMDQAVGTEKKISSLYNRIYKRAKDTAMQMVPGILKEMREKAQKEADKKAKIKAKLTEKKLKKKGHDEAAKASKIYMDQMAAAGKSAAEYAKLGDGLIAQSASAQMNAGLMAGQANGMVRLGNQAEAEKLFQQSRMDMNTALGLNAQATGMYNTANKITAQLPAYAGQAAAAGYHAQVMYDPEAVPPPPPLV